MVVQALMPWALYILEWQHTFKKYIIVKHVAIGSPMVSIVFVCVVTILQRTCRNFVTNWLRLQDYNIMILWTDNFTSNTVCYSRKILELAREMVL
jgi:hypothetical protein